MEFRLLFHETLAQSVEHLTFNERVDGSSPSSLKFFIHFDISRLGCFKLTVLLDFLFEKPLPVQWLKSSQKEGCGMEMQIGLTKESRQAVGEGLMQLLADTYALYLKTQSFHWNVKGIYFYPLHLLFETHYEEMAPALDEIAERIRALGLPVEASFSFFKAKTTIKEDLPTDALEMVKQLIEGHESVIRGARRLAMLAERENDPATVDLLGRRLGTHEKMVWFLRNHLEP